MITEIITRDYLLPNGIYKVFITGCKITGEMYSTFTRTIKVVDATSEDSILEALGLPSVTNKISGITQVDNVEYMNTCSPAETASALTVDALLEAHSFEEVIELVNTAANR